MPYFALCPQPIVYLRINKSKKSKHSKTILLLLTIAKVLFGKFRKKKKNDDNFEKKKKADVKSIFPTLNGIYVWFGVQHKKIWDRQHLGLKKMNLVVSPIILL